MYIIKQYTVINGDNQEHFPYHKKVKHIEIERKHLEEKHNCYSKNDEGETIKVKYIAFNYKFKFRSNARATKITKK